jgi:hypothetical protein
MSELLHTFRRKNLREKAATLVVTLLVLTLLSTIVVAFVQTVSMERSAARSVANRYQAELAAQAGANMAKSQLISAINHPDAGGVAYTVWSYFTATNNDASYTAITVGRPATLNDTNYLATNNTTWLFSPPSTNAPADPDTISNLSEDSKIDLGEFFDKPPISVPVSVPWHEFSRKTNSGLIEIHRFAYWVEDDSSRINIQPLLATNHFNASANNPRRQNGSLPAEIIPSEIFPDATLSKLTNSALNIARTDKSVFQALSQQESDLLNPFSSIFTTHSKSHNRIRYGPATGAANNFRRGTRKLNLNWPNLTNTTIAAQERVNLIADAIERGAPDFYSSDHVKYYQNSTPAGANPDQSAPASIRREMRESLAASIIDYIDDDNIPLQPNLQNPNDLENPPPPVRMVADIGRPRFFGSESAPVINEIEIIWNADINDVQAKPNVNRSGDAEAGYTYTIPILWRFELWNMSDQSIPARSYSIRAYSHRQIRGAAFGFGGTPMPPETELVLDLGIHDFSPGEIKILSVSEEYTSTGPRDLGTTWNRFRLGPDGLGGLNPGNATTNADDEPERHARSSFVLFDSSSGKWISNTLLLDSSNVLGDGRSNFSPGNMGESFGNRVNDPRSQPSFVYSLNAALTGYDSSNSSTSDRDWSQNSGSLGTINNNIPATSGGNRFYQHLGFWFDRPRLNTGNAGEQPESALEISRIRNSSMANIGELGNIFDPSWHNPINRGSDSNPANNFPYRRGGSSGVRSPFRGGASLRIGQPDGRTNYAQNSWILTDVFTSDWNAVNQQVVPNLNQRGVDEQKGLININSPKYAQISSGVNSTIAAALRLPTMQGVANGAGTSFFPDRVVESIRQRLSRGAENIASWQQARPFYLPGEISELDVWQEPTLYNPEETLVWHPTANTNAPRRLNRGDFAREEITQRSLALLTTGGNVFRIYVIGQYLTAPINQPNNLTLRSSVAFEEVVDMKSEFDETTGQQLSIQPITLQISHE